MRHIILSIILAIIWLLNSGHYNGLLLSLGVVSIVFVVWITHKMDVVDQETQHLHVAVGIPTYWLWLIKEIVLSNIDVVKAIWLDASTIDPVTETFKISQKRDIGRVVYANSITLTPGTVTLDLKEDEVTVHALTRDGMDELKKGEMDRRVTNLEK